MKSLILVIIILIIIIIGETICLIVCKEENEYEEHYTENLHLTISSLQNVINEQNKKIAILNEELEKHKTTYKIQIVKED